MQKFSLFLLMCTLVLVSSPSVSHAYTVTNKQAVRINDTYTLYLISYAFGHKSRTFMMPAVASRGETVDETDLEYTLKTPEGLTVKDGVSAATIWTKAAKQGDHYTTAVGTSTSFTLAVLHAKSATSSRANTLSVEALPFTIGTTKSSLAKHELAPYTVSATGTAPLNTNDE